MFSLPKKAVTFTVRNKTYKNSLSASVETI